MAKSVRVEIKLNKIPNIAQATQADIAGVIARAALALERTEKELIVEQDIIDTSFMLNSVQAIQEDKMNWVVGNGAEYSVVQNYGSATQPARPFVEPAIDIVKPMIIEDVKRVLGSL